jgi:hypothetical protein
VLQKWVNGKVGKPDLAVSHCDVYFYFVQIATQPALLRALAKIRHLAQQLANHLSWLSRVSGDK